MKFIGASDNDLRREIYEQIPPSHKTFGKLLSLVDVEISRKVPTAEITLGPQSVLRINPDFVRRHCRRPGSLAALVMHELYHVLLGHTRMYRRVTPAENIAFDAIINARICRLSTELPRDVRDFFIELYAPDRFPEALLRPPALTHWGERGLTGTAAEVHRALYDSGEVTVAELLDLLERDPAGESSAAVEAPPSGGDSGGAPDDRGGSSPAKSPRAGRERQIQDGASEDEGNSSEVPASRADTSVPPADSLEGVVRRLLGSHGREEHGALPPATEGIPAKILGEFREIVTQVERRSTGWRPSAGRAGLEQSVEVIPEPRRKEIISVIRQAILAVAAENVGHLSGSLVRRVPRAAFVPWTQRLDRRTAVLTGLGHPPLLSTAVFQNTVPAFQPTVTLYVDVSGSMDHYLPLLLPALHPLVNFLEFPIRAFSNQVLPATRRELLEGRFRTTSGTDIRCVTRDMVNRRIRRAVIITDGYVGRVPAKHVDRLRASRLAVVLTPDGCTDQLSELRPRVFRLPPV